MLGLFLQSSPPAPYPQPPMASCWAACLVCCKGSFQAGQGPQKLAPPHPPAPCFPLLLSSPHRPALTSLSAMWSMMLAL